MTLVSTATYCIIQHLQQKNVSDPFLLKLHSRVAQYTLEPPFSILEGLMTHKGLYFPSPASTFYYTMVSECHDNLNGGQAR